MNVLSLISFFNCIGFSCFAICIAKSEATGGERRSGTLINISAAVWAFAYTFFYSAADQHVAWFWLKVGALGWCTLPCFSTYYYVQLSEADKHLGKGWRNLLFFLFPAVLTLSNLLSTKTSVAYALVESGSGWGWTYVNSPDSIRLWVYIAYLLFYFGVGFYLVFRWGKRKKLIYFKRQANLIVYIFGLIVVLGLFSDLVLPLFSHFFPPLAVLFLIVVLYGDWVITARLNFLAVSDQIKSRLMLETITDAVLAVNRRGGIIRANRAASDLFGIPAQTLIGRCIRTFLADPLVLSKNLQNLVDKHTRKDMDIKIRNADGRVIPTVVSASIAENSAHGFLGVVLSFHDISRQKEMENALRDGQERYKSLASDYYHLANYDVLTGLANRRHVFEQVGRLQFESGLSSAGIALIFMDLNGFKKINDQYGHAIGDQLLVEASKRLRACRGEKDILARMGGDEFVLLLVDADIHGAGERIGQIRMQFQKPIVLGAVEHMVGIAAGFSVCLKKRLEKDDISFLLREADEAMYKDKQIQKHSG